MSKTPHFDSKVKAILDTTQPGERVCRLTGEKWLMDQTEIDWYKQFNVPPSTVHPIARLKYLFGFTSGVALWWKPHAETGKPILSFIHPDNPFKVIPDREWFERDFLGGVDWSVDQPFFAQFSQLAYSIPVGSLRDDGSNVNSIAVDLIESQDCYMAFSSGFNKRVTYFTLGHDNEDCLDATNNAYCRECFSINHCARLYRCSFAFESRECIDSTFLFDCRDCEFCFGATNRRHGKYLFFNEQLSKEDWEQRVGAIDLSSHTVREEYQRRFDEFVSTAVWPQNFNTATIESSGEYLDQSVRCQECFWDIQSVDLSYCWETFDLQRTAYCVWVGWGSEMYFSGDMVKSQDIKFCFRTWRCQAMEYSMNCYDCHHCFGCFGLRHKSFCLFNRQYSEADYWRKLDELKCAMLDRGEYGEFFPATLSESGFQFSQGKLFFDYTEKEYADFGASKFDPGQGTVIMPNTIEAEGAIHVDQIPDCLSEIDAALFVNKPIHDEKLNRNFSVVDREFAFYQARHLPFPREHFLTRLKKLIRHSNSPLKEMIKCGSCQKEIVTYQNVTYPDRTIFCTECYQSYLETK